MEQILGMKRNESHIFQYLYMGISWFCVRVCRRHTWLQGKRELELPRMMEMKEPISSGMREKQEQQAEEMMNEYGDSILRLAYSYLHNMADAEDILQDTMIAYIQDKPILVNPRHEKAWLLRVAANKSKNKIDYNRIRQTDELAEQLSQERRDDLSYVWDAVKQLPEKYREAIHLFYYEGYSTKEMARILRRREGSVRSDLSRARQMLREILGEVYDFE